MNRLEELILEYCPDGVEDKPLEEILRIRNGSDYKGFSVGDIPVYGSGGIMTYIDHFAYDKPSVLIPRKGSIDKLYYVDTPFWNVDTIFYTEIDTTKALPKYVYHCLLREHLEQYNIAGGVPSLTQKALNKVKIPVPPLPVQYEIVRILDNFTEKVNELQKQLTKELAAQKKQYEYYRDLLLRFDNTSCSQDCNVEREREAAVRWLTLSEIAEITTGSSNTDEAEENGAYPFYVRSNEPLAKNTYEYDEEAIITAGDGAGVGKVFHYVNGKYALHQRAYRIHPKINLITGKYLYYYFVSVFPTYINKQMFQGSVPSIRRPMLNRFEVAVPSINEQKRIISALDSFESLFNDITLSLTGEITDRQKQYEYYRDKLLTFKGKALE